MLDQAEAELRSAGWPGVLTRVTHSGPAAAFVDMRPADIRMVVLGRRGTGGFREALVGSTAYVVAETSGVPVVIVPDEWNASSTQDRPVVLGLDCDTGNAAIGFAFDLATLTSQTVQATHVLAPETVAVQAPVGYWPPAPPATPGNERVDEARRVLAEQLAGWSEKYPDVKVRRSVVAGSPVEELLAEGRSARLLVVGCNDEGPRSPAGLGSVARYLMHYATCPVAVVHSV
jgi:nucleotide-binding universal stress UspA family protein